MMLTPDLTDGQRRNLQAELTRLTACWAAPLIYTDADRLAGRWRLSPQKVRLGAVEGMVEELARAHQAPSVIVAFLAGMAHGVRLGRTLIAPLKRPVRVPISDAYRGLPAGARREADRFIRTLVRAADKAAQALRPTTAAERQADIDACQTLGSVAGRLARKGGAR